MLLFLAVTVAPMLFVWLLWELDERDLRATYRMFGTTGFWDVDQRFRREEEIKVERRINAELCRRGLD